MSQVRFPNTPLVAPLLRAWPFHMILMGSMPPRSMCSRANRVIPSPVQLIAAEVIVEKLAVECIPQYDCFAVNKTRHRELGCMWSGIPDEEDPCFVFHRGVKADCSGATEYDLDTTHLQCFMVTDYDVRSRASVLGQNDVCRVLT